MQTKAVQLVDLEPTFLVIDQSNVHRRELDDMARAQGLMLLCPKCLYDVRARSHSLLCWFADRDVPDVEMPTGARWVAIGTSYADLTLEGDIAVRGGCGWRGQIARGAILLPDRARNAAA